MKKVDVPNVMQLVANFCVVGGIILLAVEIRQNNELLGVEIRTNGVSRSLSSTDVMLEIRS